MGDGAEQLDLLGHALGEAADLQAGGVAEAVGFQQLQRPPLGGAGRHALETGEEDDGVDRGHAAIEPAFLGQEADAVAHLAHVLAPQHHHPALVGRHQAQDHAKRGGLAGAIGAEEAGEPAVLGLEAEAVDRLKSAEALAHAFDGQSVVHPPARASADPERRSCAADSTKSMALTISAAWRNPSRLAWLALAMSVA